MIFKVNAADDTGRFMVISSRTGKKYLVEPIGSARIDWGDVDPASKKLTGSYGSKYRGSINEDETLITEENGFRKITTLKAGESPLKAIEEMDSKYPTQSNRGNG